MPTGLLISITPFSDSFSLCVKFYVTGGRQEITHCLFSHSKRYTLTTFNACLAARSFIHFLVPLKRNSFTVQSFWAARATYTSPTGISGVCPAPPVPPPLEGGGKG